MSMSGPDNGFENQAVRPGSAATYPGRGGLLSSGNGPGVDDWAVDDQLAELGRVLTERIGALAAAVAGVWGGLVAGGRARLRRRLAAGRAEARDLGAAETMAWPRCTLGA